MKTIEITLSSASEAVEPKVKVRKPWVPKEESLPLRTMFLAKERDVQVYVTMEGDPTLLIFKRGEDQIGTISYDRCTPDWFFQALKRYEEKR